MVSIEHLNLVRFIAAVFDDDIVDLLDTSACV